MTTFNETYSVDRTNPSAATETRGGIVELATTAEATAGTDPAKVVTPAGLTSAFAKTLKFRANIPTAANLNDYTDNGFYYQASNANAAAGTNYPVPLAGILIVVKEGSWTAQTYRTYNSGRVYTRTASGVTWSAWLTGGIEILGSVSQSGGVPTGALFESGSNANGNYMRFASGLQICWGEVAATITTPTVITNIFGSTAGSLNAQNIAVTIPAAFINTDYTGRTTPTTRGMTEYVIQDSVTSFRTQIRQLSTSNQAIPFSWFLFGRWF